MNADSNDVAICPLSLLSDADPTVVVADLGYHVGKGLTPGIAAKKWPRMLHTDGELVVDGFESCPSQGV